MTDHEAARARAADAAYNDDGYTGDTNPTSWGLAPIIHLKPQPFVAGKPGWWTQAACRNSSPDLFFGERTSSRTWVADAKAVCSTCLVIDLCLADNIDVRFGVFGGTTPDERLKMRKARNHQGDTA